MHDHRDSYRTSLLLISLLLAAPLVAQEQKTAPSSSVFRETAEVELVNVDVVVTDTKGKPVRGLDRNSFTVYEDGVPQEITHFEAIDRVMDSVKLEGGDAPVATAASTPDELPRVMIFVDNMSLHPLTRNKVMEFSSDFASKVLDKGGEVMVVSSLNGTTVRLPFSRDRKAIDDTLRAVMRELGGGAAQYSQLRAMQSEILAAIDERDALRTARMYAFQVKNNVERTVEGIRAACRILAPVSGRKAMVILSEGLPIDPGSDAFRFVEVAKSNTTSLAPFVTPEFSLSHVMKSLAESASNAGVALYPVHARGLSGFGTMLADESSGFQVGSFRNEEVKNLDDGKYAFGVEEGKRATFSESFVIEREANLASRASMELLASMTGGFATVGSGDFRKAFEGITRDLDVYYSIAYRRQSNDRRKHTIAVEVPKTKYLARFRRSTVLNSPEEEARDRVTSALMTPPAENPLGLMMQVYPAQREKRGYRIPVQIAVPVSALTLADNGTSHTTELRLFVRVADGRQRMTQIGEKIAKITIPVSELEASRAKYYTTQLDLVSEPGNYRIAAVLLDQNSLQSGVATASYHAGELRAAETKNPSGGTR